MSINQLLIQRKSKNKVSRCGNQCFYPEGFHTSGHANRDGLKKMVEVVKPKTIVPIHTFEGDEYKDIFSDSNVQRVNDGEIADIT